MYINDSLSLSYDDVLIVPQFSSVGSRSEVELNTKIGYSDFSLPIVSSNMDTITGPKMAQSMAEMGGLGIIHRYMSVEEQKNILLQWCEAPYGPIGLSVGTLKNDKERIDATVDMAKFYKKNITICVDIAHGHSQHMIDTLKYIRDRGHTWTLMAGAVATPKGVRDLLEAGADIVRVGIGPGSACTTRLKTGCGYPQFSAVKNCAMAGPIIADGGIKKPGDAAKALAVGAKAVMIGGMFAGSDCVPNWVPHASHMRFRGMASAEARETFGQPGINSEGISTDVPTLPEGSTQQIVKNIDEGIRSAMSYSDSKNLEEFHEKVEFCRVTSSTVVENTPHILM